MAIDVWNMVKTKGINARIVAGNVNKPDAEWQEFNHAWVVAESAPRQWIALETTRGYLVSMQQNKNYYRGLFFKSPRDLKEHLERRRQANDLIKRTIALQEELKKIGTDYDQEAKKYTELVDEHKKKYPNRFVPMGLAHELQASKEKIAQQGAKVKEIEGRGNQLNELMDSNIAELNTLEQQSIETISSN